MLKVVSFGEILWDVFPTMKKIGGAPLNLALRFHALGAQVNMISSIGNDSKGNEIKKHLENIGFDTGLVQRHSNLPTSEVLVKLNKKGSASYEIVSPVAWDDIEINAENKKAAASSDLFIFGSLSSRSTASEKTLKTLLSQAKYKIFDVNLRPPYYTSKLLLKLLKASNFVKFNDDELFEVAGLMDCKFNGMEQTTRFIADKAGIETICVTKGAFGAVLYYKNKFYYNSGYRINVCDTVGSGDSFLASIAFKLFSGDCAQDAIDFACAIGALVASYEGANPTITEDEIRAFMNPTDSSF